MSLINEALKKAQRNRSADPAGTLPPMPGGGRVSKRSQPRTSQQLILIAAGAIALVVLSVVATVYLVNRPPETKPAAAVTKPAAPAPTPSAAAPVAVTPAVSLPVIAPKPIPEPPAATATTTPAAAPPPATVENKPAVALPRPPAADAPAVAATPATAPAAVAPSPAPPAAPAASIPAPAPAGPAKPDERVNAFVDAIKVAGIRSSGTESRVLMNDRVFRVNDIVERNFGLRLTAVEANALTFTDANGAVYIKNF